MTDQERALIGEHVFMEALGGYIECSCGWPSQEQFMSDEPTAFHVVELVLRSRTPGSCDAPPSQSDATPPQPSPKQAHRQSDSN